MSNVYEILRKKEDDIVRVQKEIQALRFVAPLLSESADPQVPEPQGDFSAAPVSLEPAAVENEIHESSLPVDEPESPEVSQAIPPKRSRLRNLLGLAAGE